MLDLRTSSVVFLFSRLVLVPSSSSVSTIALLYLVRTPSALNPFTRSASVLTTGSQGDTLKEVKFGGGRFRYWRSSMSAFPSFILFWNLIVLEVLSSYQDQGDNFDGWFLCIIVKFYLCCILVCAHIDSLMELCFKCILGMFIDMYTNNILFESFLTYRQIIKLFLAIFAIEQIFSYFLIYVLSWQSFNLRSLYFLVAFLNMLCQVCLLFASFSASLLIAGLAPTLLPGTLAINSTILFFNVTGIINAIPHGIWH